MSERVALVDMDGTLVDYDSVMRRELEALRSPGEPVFETSPEGGYPDWIEARRRLISLRPGFWRGLPKLQVGFDVVLSLEALGFCIHVLTKGPSHKPAAWSEKVEWCREHLPSALVTVTEDKSIAYGRVLVDDWPPYFEAWLEHRPRGIVIVPAHPWNEGCEKFAPGNIYRYDRSDPRPLHRILKAVRARRSGEAIDLDAILASCADLPPFEIG
jgi:FMN phosphatase YigB (HAD superfamily)